MYKQLFITGTGTDVGKTYVAALLLKKLQQLGVNPSYYKAAMSGNLRNSSGTLIPGDADVVQRISKIQQPLDTMCPYVYEHAVSPHLAAKLEGPPVRLDIIQQGFDALRQKYDYVVVEGSGGIVCPLNADDEPLFLEDVIKKLSLSSLLVADAGLGTINAVVLTVQYMRKKKLPIKGIIFNRFHPESIMEADNLHMCEALTGIKVVACVGEDDGELHIAEESLFSLFD
ncbi:dethiobiotin synthetase [Clostridiales Family XIII bacterium PM5-7]